MPTERQSYQSTAVARHQGVTMFTSGMHILQDDLPAAEARALLGPRRILGVSVKTPEQAVAAAAAGADYLGAGAGGENWTYPGSMSSHPCFS